jgi:TolB-like protein/Tfp pilus assembly protein PilF
LSFFNELKRRNVFRVGIAYVIAAWLIAQVLGLVLDSFGAPVWLMKTVLVLMAAGFPLALIFAWAFELTPDGVKRESEVDRTASIRPKTGKKLDRVIIGVLIVALGYIAIDKLVLEPSQEAELIKAAQKAVVEEGVEKSVEPAATEVIDKSIAVLPFVNMSNDPDQEYFSDGISEELLNLLTKIPQLKVIARTSSFSFKGKDTPIDEIAQRLNVAHVLEGSVRKSGDRVRITAQLIRASDSTHLWSESYDRTLDDIFAVQDEIAATVVAQLKVKLLGDMPKVEATDPKAYALLLQSRQVYNQGTSEAMEQAIALLQKALAIDPESSLLWGELARVYVIQGSLDFRYRESFAINARDAARRALALNPNNALAENALGIVARYADHDRAAEARHYQRALALEPAHLRTLRSAGTLALALGQVDNGLSIQKFVVSRDPAGPWGHVWLGFAYLVAGSPDDALASFRTALELSPNFQLIHLMIGYWFLDQGDLEAALKSILLGPQESFRLEGLAAVHHALGNAAESDAALNELIAKYGRQRPVAIAKALAFRGEIDRAFEWLEKGVEYRDPRLMELGLTGMWPGDEVLSEDLRWLPFLESIGMSPAQLDAIEFNVTLPE